MVNIHIYVAKYKIVIQDFEIFPDFVPPFLHGGRGYFGFAELLNMMDAASLTSWMKLNSLWMFSGPQNSFPLPTSFKTPPPTANPLHNQTEPSHYNPPPPLKNQTKYL